MKKLKVGNIYSFHYYRYQVDPNPLVLVLYWDKEICHALNFHYLKDKLTAELIQMIAMFAIKKSKNISMYQHYHNWMKKYIPSVIKHAYRTYKPEYITSIKQVTEGAWGIDTFIKHINQKEKYIVKTKIQERLSKKINQEKVNVFKNKKINLNKLENYIINYIDEAEKIIQKSRKENQSLYTRLHKR